MSRDRGSALAELARAQNADGGWGYARAVSSNPAASHASWTEPSCYAALALDIWGNAPESVARCRQWLLAQQRIDGGWAPRACVSQSTSVTALACMTLAACHSAASSWRKGVDWLVGQVGQPTSLSDRARTWLFGSNASRSDPAGWSWFPGTASWVTPTSLALIALSGVNDSQAQRRAEQGRAFLMARRCRDLGWNHGGSFFRSESAPAYPETTGIALAALQRVPPAQLTASLDYAQSLVTHAGSVQGQAWLAIALAAHGKVPSAMGKTFHAHTVIDQALILLAEAAREGRNAFAMRTA